MTFFTLGSPSTVKLNLSACLPSSSHPFRCKCFSSACPLPFLFSLRSFPHPFPWLHYSCSLNDFHIYFQPDLFLAFQFRISQLPAGFLHPEAQPVLHFQQRLKLIHHLLFLSAQTCIIPTFYIYGGSISGTQTWNLGIILDFSFYTSHTQIKLLNLANVLSSCISLLYPRNVCAHYLIITGC